jgi:hypothetical protein
VTTTSKRDAFAERGGHQQHALISTSKEIGVATGILPVVSTLTFGFATSVLLGEDAVPGSVLLLVCASAVCSLYTTVYSVLEFYYVAMLTAGDAKSAYMGGNGSGAEDQQYVYS